MSRQLQMRTPVYQSLLTRNRYTVLVTVNDSEGEEDSTLETTMCVLLASRSGRVRTLISRQYSRFPAGRNDKNCVKWKEDKALIAINSLFASFSTV